MSKKYFWLNKSKSRYYTISIINNSINHQWGSCSTNRGGKKEIVINSEEEINTTINKMLKRRKSRGYELIG